MPRRTGCKLGRKPFPRLALWLAHACEDSRVESNRRAELAKQLTAAQVSQSCKNESGRRVRGTAGTVQQLASQPRQEVSKTARLETGKPLELD